MSKHISKERLKTDSHDSLWPDKQYYEKIEKLKSLIGQKIYLIEAVITDINASVHHTSQAYTLLAIVDYPQPDHKTGLLPHNIIIDDGRGINMGRIIQISTGSAFNPQDENIIFDNLQLLDEIYPSWKRLGNYSLENRSKNLLASLIGKPETEAPEIESLEDPNSYNSTDTGKIK